MTPQQLRDINRVGNRAYYGTASHRGNVEHGNYHDLDHALLARSMAARSAAGILADRSQADRILRKASVIERVGDEAEFHPPEWMSEGQRKRAGITRLRTRREKLDRSILVGWVVSEELHRQATGMIDKYGKREDIWPCARRQPRSTSRNSNDCR